MKVCLHCQQPREGDRCETHDVRLTPAVEGALEPDEMIGRALGDRFRLERLLGQGGMGMVFLARHVLLDREFAIKVLDAPRGVQDKLAARFLREARVASRVRHPHVIDITDFGVTRGGALYLVMELLPGRSLRELIHQRAPMPPRVAARLAVQICEALEAIHAAGVAHRDLKPENCQVLDPEAPDAALRLKVLDFGIVALLEQEDGARLTGEGAVIGTPAYMPPEQVSGLAIDGRADIYATGCILFELLTGTAFVDAKSASDAMVKQLMQPVRAPSSLNPAVPGWLDELVVACLAKDPEDRPGSAAVLRDWLESELDGSPTVASASTMPQALAPSKAPAPAPLVTQGERDSAPTQQISSGRALRLAVVGVVLLVVAAGMGVLGYLDRAPPAAMEAAAPRSLEWLPRAPQVATSRPEPAAPAPAPPDEAVPDPAPTPTVRLETVPPGASVFVGDTLLGVTPLEVPWPTGALAPTLRLEQEGRQARRVTLAPGDRGQTRQVVLAPTPARRPRPVRAAAPAPTPEPAPAPPPAKKKQWDLVPDDR